MNDEKKEKGGKEEPFCGDKFVQAAMQEVPSGRKHHAERKLAEELEKRGATSDQAAMRASVFITLG